MNNYYVVDAEGVVVDELNSLEDYVKLNEGDYVLKRGQLDYLAGSVKLDYKYVKVNNMLLYELSRKYTLLPFFIEKINYMENVISHSNGKRMYKGTIYKYAKLSESTCKRQLAGMLKDDIIHRKRENGRTYYVLNCWIAHIGKKVAKPLYEEFENSIYRDYEYRLKENEKQE